MTIYVVYDGLCAFCIRSLRILDALDRRRVLELHDANDRAGVLERFPELRNADLDAAMYVIDEDRRVYAGFYAFRRIARELPAARIAHPLLSLPGVGYAGSKVYALIARNRRRLGCRVV